MLDAVTYLFLLSSSVKALICAFEISLLQTMKQFSCWGCLLDHTNSIYQTQEISGEHREGHVSDYRFTDIERNRAIFQTFS